MSDYLQKIVYLTKEQYNQLITSQNQTITVGSTTHQYNANNLYFTTDDNIAVTDLGDNFILPVTKGGTGKTEFAAGALLVGQGSGATQFGEVSATNSNIVNTIVQRDSNGNFSAGTITASLFSGSGASLTNLNGSNISSGTVPFARLPTGTGSSQVAKGDHTHSYAGSSSAGGAATSANALNFVHTNEILIGNTNAQAGIHINHRRVLNGATTGNTAITDYYFKNGNGATTGVTVHAANFNGIAEKATNDVDGNAIKTTYAKLASPALTGTPTAPTAENGTSTTQIATTEFVNNTLAYVNAMQFKGTLGTGGTVTALPASHEAGDTYRVVTAGTYAGKYCEVGTLIICIKDGTAATDADWTSVETNEDGSVIGPLSSTANQIAKFSSATGRVITNSGVTIDDSNNIYTTGILETGRYFHNVATYSCSNTPKEILIKTKIPFANSAHMPKIIIHMYNYSDGLPTEIGIVFYIYNGAFCNMGVTSNTKHRPKVTLCTYTESDTKYVGIGLGLADVSADNLSHSYYIHFNVDYLDIWPSITRTSLAKGWTITGNTSTTSIIPTTDRKNPSYVDQAQTAKQAAFTSNQWGISYYSDTTGTFASTGTGTSGQYLKSNGSSAPTWATFPTTLNGYGITDAATSDHTHGNLTNDGCITTAITVAQNDYIIIGDNSSSGKIGKGPVFCDTISSQTTSSKFLREDGTWSAPSYLTIGTTATTAMAGDTTVTDVYQSNTSTPKWRKVLLSYNYYENSNDSVGNGVTDQVYASYGISVQPETGSLYTGGGIGKNNWIAYPQGGTYNSTTGTVTGALKITLPQGNKKTMIMFDVNIYTHDQSNETRAVYHISGYESTNGWSEARFKVYSEGIGNFNNLKVRFGLENNKTYITIGEITTAWRYPQIAISNILIGYQEATYDLWQGPWAITFVETLPESMTGYRENINIQDINVSGTAAKATGDADGNAITSTYLKLSGGTMTGNIRRYYSTASTEPMITALSKNLDIYLWQVGHGDEVGTNLPNNGYKLLYKGTNDSTNNYLQLIATKADGTETIAMQLDELGNANYKGEAHFNLGTSNTSTNYRKFTIQGESSNKMSIGPTGIQVYNSSNAAQTLYFQAYGGNIIVGSDSYKTATRTMHGVYTFPSSATAFNFSGMGAASDNAARNIWFSYNGQRGTPVYDDDFKYNPSTNVMTVGKMTITGGTADSSLSTSGALTISSSANKAITINSGYTIYLNSPSSTSIIFTKAGADTSHEMARFDTSSNFVPKSGLTNTIGTNSLKWTAIYANTFYGDVEGHASDDLPLTGGELTGNLTLFTESGDSPSLIFKRSADTTLTDWRLIVKSGKLSIEKASDASTWTQRAFFGDSNTDGFTINGITSINTNITSGACVTITNSGQGSGGITGLTCVSPDMPAGSNTYISVGKAGSTKNRGYIGFYYAANSSDNNYLKFGLYSADDLMIIKGNGNVGIGTISPNAKLEVNGNGMFDGKISFAISSTEKAYMTYNSTDNSIDFMFA